MPNFEELSPDSEAYYHDPHTFLNYGVEPGVYTAPRWVVPIIETHPVDAAGTLPPTEPYTLPLPE